MLLERNRWMNGWIVVERISRGRSSLIENFEDSKRKEDPGRFVASIERLMFETSIQFLFLLHEFTRII